MQVGMTEILRQKSGDLNHFSAHMGKIETPTCTLQKMVDSPDLLVLKSQFDLSFRAGGAFDSSA